MNVGDLVIQKDTFTLGVVTSVENRGFDHRGDLFLCRVDFPSSDDWVWIWSYELEVLNANR